MLFRSLFWVFLTSNILIYGAEVAAELPHVLNEEPRHGSRDEGDWRVALLAFARGLVMVPEDDEPEDIPIRRGRRRVPAGTSGDGPA